MLYKTENLWGKWIFLIVPHFTTMEYFSKFDNTFQKLKCTYPLKRLEKRKCILIFRYIIIYLEISPE